MTCFFFGGDGEDRTLDLLNAIQALSRYTQKRTLICRFIVGIDKAAKQKDPGRVLGSARVFLYANSSF